MAADGDTIPVREEERVDVRRLHGYLKGRLEGADAPPQVRQFPAGKANLTYLLRFPEREYVLRRPPLGPVAPSAHDMSREFRVLEVLHRTYPPAPRAYLFCADPEVIGAPFFVMERRSGVVVRERLPAAFEAAPRAGEELSGALVRALAEFHSVDYEQLGLADLGKPEGFIRRQVEGWTRRWWQAVEQPLPEMDACAAWLAENLPPSSAHTLVHNDFKLDNAMFDPRDPGRVVAVFDWDMCTLGDPLSDLGSLLAYWSQPDDDPQLRAMAMMPREGFWTRRQLLDEYGKLTGRDLSRADFYHCLGLFRLAVIIAQIYVRYLRGQTSDERFAVFGRWIPVVAREAARVAGL